MPSLARENRKKFDTLMVVGCECGRDATQGENGTHIEERKGMLIPRRSHVER